MWSAYPTAATPTHQYVGLAGAFAPGASVVAVDGGAAPFNGTLLGGATPKGAAGVTFPAAGASLSIPAWTSVDSNFTLVLALQAFGTGGTLWELPPWAVVTAAGQAAVLQNGVTLAAAPLPTAPGRVLVRCSAASCSIKCGAIV